MAERDIPFSHLVKAGYNRGISRSHVNEIKNDFHEDMVQPAIVSLREGKYYIIDHQHQSQAIYERNGSDPSTLIRCKVLTGLTYEQEADLYYRLNTSSKPLKFADKMIGLIEAKDPKALEFRDTVESCGFIIGGDYSNSLRALKAACSIFNRDGGKDTLAEILSLVNACWPNNRNSAKAEIISGIDMFIRFHGNEYRRNTFVKNLSRQDPRTIVSKGVTYYKQMDSKAYTKQYCIYTQLFHCYNANLKRHRLVIVPVTQL
jgi:hypothetical protein